MKEFAALQDMTQMPLLERLGHSLTVTVLGMGITFLVLILLLFAIKIMSSVLKEKEKPLVKEVAPVLPQETHLLEQEEDQGELVAILMAAIVASSGLPYERLRLRSFREVSVDLPLWSQAGIAETMNREI